MMATPRPLAALLLALVPTALGATALGPAVRAEPANAAVPPTSDRREDVAPLDGRLAAFVAELRPEALAAGVKPDLFERTLAGLSTDPTILELMARQPEHVMAPWDYLGRLVSETRIVEGRQKLAEHAAILAEVEARYGVDRHVVVAIWGIESSYGTAPGTRQVIRSLATLAVADPRRPAFWRQELLAALAIVQNGDIAADRMSGSWAGAMGHTQFMPTSYLRHAVDFDGDGRRDIWQSVPDALASTASYLKRFGWQTGEPWGTEVLLPAGFDDRLLAARDPRPVAEWTALGLTPPAGSDWPARLQPSALVLPAGLHGPAFLVAANFQTILKYNNATLYALAVGHLADRLAARPALAAPWPTDDPPLDLAGRRELQQRLAAEGHPVGPVDGVIGDGTRGAIRAWQRSAGLRADGWAGHRLLERLRQASTTAP